MPEMQSKHLIKLIMMAGIVNSRQNSPLDFLFGLVDKFDHPSDWRVGDIVRIHSHAAREYADQEAQVTGTTKARVQVQMTTGEMKDVKKKIKLTKQLS